MNIFEKASRLRIRFTSARGELTVEQLWSLPLTAARPDHIDLDDVAKQCARELRDVTEESFVATKVNPRKPELELKLEVVKHIIAVKQKEAEDARDAAKKRERRQELLEILAAKESDEMRGMSKEELLAELEKVS